MLVFLAKFAVAAPICTVLWWLASPAYLAVLGHAVAAVLNTLFRAGIEAVEVITQDDILNTRTLLGFAIEGRVRPIPLVGLVMGIPTFVALTVASPWPGAARFALNMAAGTGILIATHLLYVVLVFQYTDALQASPQLPYMIVMLPFLLWLVLSYWPQIAAYFDDPPAK